MTPASFIAWRERLSLDKKAAAAALGCTRNFIYSMESGSTKIPRYIALACQAISNGLPPMGWQLEKSLDTETEDETGFPNENPPIRPSKD